MEPNSEDLEDREEETEMTTATAKKVTTAERIVEVLGEREEPLTVDEISKLMDAKPATVERAARNMSTSGQLVKTGGKNGEPVKYGLPPATQTKGEIAGQVIAFLAAHPDESFSPYRIAKEIERFPGSVAWTCAKMASRGELVQVSEKPVKYALP